jgi:hypothetical protein
MSPRTLHFARNQSYWLCTSLTACASHPDGISKERSEPKFGRWRVGYKLEMVNTSTAPMSDGLKIVEAYSKLALTFPSDKLVAISGFAR